MKRPSFQFYPGDWQRDASLRMCSVSARGLWIEMLCIMHQGSPYGHLKVNGKAISLEQLGRMVGANSQEVTSWLAELESANVFERDQDGAIFSRRMVRDEEIRQVRADGGKLGGNPALVGEYNQPGFVYLAYKSDGKYKIGASTQPSKRMYKIRQQYPGMSITIIAQMPVQDMGKEESNLHAKYQHCRDGEWFALTENERDGLIHLMVNPKQITTPSSSSSIKTKPTPPMRVTLPSWLPQEAWEGFAEMRKRIRAPLTQRAADGIIAELSAFRDKGHDPVKILDTSTQRAWRGVFEPKPEERAQSGHSANTLDIFARGK